MFKKLVGILLIGASIALTSCANHNTVIRDGQIIDVYGNEITVLTDDGNLWEYRGDAVLYAEVEIVFDTQGTENVKDDAILDVVYK